MQSNAPHLAAEGLARSLLLNAQVLYGLNTQPDFSQWMYQHHVFGHRDRLTAQSMINRAPFLSGARITVFVLFTVVPIREVVERL